MPPDEMGRLGRDLDRLASPSQRAGWDILDAELSPPSTTILVESRLDGMSSPVQLQASLTRHASQCPTSHSVRLPP